jgi:FHS family glucose/mannose:H+ symporter-like MFS transporter
MIVSRPHFRTLFGLGSVAPIHFLAYFLAGVATVSLGAVLPQLVKNWSMSDAQAGFLFSSLFAGSTLGSLVSTRKPEWSYPIGCGCCGIAIPLIQSLSIGWLDVVILLVGIGLGLIINSGNVLVENSAKKEGASGAAALARVHFAWGLGAISCPWIIRPNALSSVGPSLFLALFGGVFALLGVFLAWKVRGPLRTSSDEMTAERRSSFGLKAQFTFALALLLYTGIENSISGWLPLFVLRIYRGGVPSVAVTTKAGSLAALCFTLFWTAHLLGRALLPVALQLWPEERLLRGTITALLAAVILLSILPGRFGERGGVSCITAAACGLSLASIYPLLIADLLKQSGDLRPVGWILACAPLGGAVLPWLSGIVSTYTGNIRSALLQPSIAVALLLVLAFHLKPVDGDQAVDRTFRR